MRIKRWFAGFLLLALLGGCVVTPGGYGDGYRGYDRYRSYDDRDRWGRRDYGGWGWDRDYWNGYHRDQR